MAQARLVIKDNPVVIDGATGQSKGVTTITYEAGQDVNLFEFDPTDPKPRRVADSREVSGSPNPKRKGAILTSFLAPGETYRLCATHQDYMNEDADCVTVHALRRPAKIRLISDLSTSHGGTWIDVDAVCSTKVVCTCEVGLADSLTQDSKGLSRVEQVTAPGDSSTPSTHHAFQFASEEFLAGNIYACVVRAIGAQGDWDEGVARVTLFRRRVTVTFREIFIVNSTFGNSTGPGWFYIDFVEGALETGRNVQHWEIGNEGSPHYFGNGLLKIPTPFTYTGVFEKLTASDVPFWCQVGGTAKTRVLGTDDYVSIVKVLRFDVGKQSESKVETFSDTAKEFSGDLEYRVAGEYGAVYGP
jgi:hypothetical protein